MSEINAPSPDIPFQLEPPRFDASSRIARFTYRIGTLSFTEQLQFAEGLDPKAAEHPAFAALLRLAAWAIGTSYYKLTASFFIEAPQLPLTACARDLVRDIYENGLGEFYARNQLRRYGQIGFEAPLGTPNELSPRLASRVLLPIGGGKDSLVSVQLLEAAERPFTPFAVNPKGPILGSVDKIGRPPIYVQRMLDPQMIALSKQDDFYNGHVPSTAIISLIAALVALLYGYDTIILSNERSADEGNVSFDGRTANHQHSKSLGFEKLMARALAETTAGELGYFSLLRPYSEARIGEIFARLDRFDHVFSSCNRNFKLSGHDGPLWCGECPKCHFTFLMLAPHMNPERLGAIFGANLLDKLENAAPYRELTGLSGHKPWECVGEILEAAAVMHALSANPDWKNSAIVAALAPELTAFYGTPQLEAALSALMTSGDAHRVPADLQAELKEHGY